MQYTSLIDPRAQVGLKKTDRRKGSGYNLLERLWIRNYERDNPKCTSREVANNFNATFAGAMLPGEIQPRPKRSLAAIACLRLRRPESGATSRKRTADDASLQEKEDTGDKVGLTQEEDAEKEDGGSKG